jgi:hypothetical protein
MKREREDDGMDIESTSAPSEGSPTAAPELPPGVSSELPNRFAQKKRLRFDSTAFLLHFIVVLCEVFHATRTNVFDMICSSVVPLFSFGVHLFAVSEPMDTGASRSFAAATSHSNGCIVKVRAYGHTQRAAASRLILFLFFFFCVCVYFIRI